MAQVIFSDGSKSWAHQLDDLRERWEIRKEPSTQTEWMPVELFRQDLKNKSRHELLLMHGDLMELRKVVNKRLGIARGNSARGIYSDVNWYRDTEAAYASIGIHQQAIQAELSIRPIVRKAKIVIRPIHDHFMDIAKERMPRDVFMQWLNEAKERLDAQETQANNSIKPTPDPRLAVDPEIDEE